MVGKSLFIQAGHFPHYKYTTFVKNSHHFQEYQVVPKSRVCLHLHQVPNDNRSVIKHEPQHIIFIVFMIDTYIYLQEGRPLRLLLFPPETAQILEI